jgi:hypothetical protein
VPVSLGDERGAELGQETMRTVLASVEAECDAVEPVPVITSVSSGDNSRQSDSPGNTDSPKLV